jgi:hypothetical protein
MYVPGFGASQELGGNLGEWFSQWSNSISGDEQRLKVLAQHDLRMALADAFGKDYLELQGPTSIAETLGADARKKWDGIRSTCEWDLPSMSSAPWLQHLLGAIILAGFILPFFLLPAVLILPLVLPLSLWLEKRGTYLDNPTLDAMADRMLILNAPRVVDGQFLSEDIERVFFQLACMASGRDLNPSEWQSLSVDQALSGNNP